MGSYPLAISVRIAAIAKSPREIASQAPAATSTADPEIASLTAAPKSSTLA
jgi:hypothetical protein